MQQTKNMLLLTPIRNYCCSEYINVEANYEVHDSFLATNSLGQCIQHMAKRFLHNITAIIYHETMFTGVDWKYLYYEYKHCHNAMDYDIARTRKIIAPE